MKNVIFALVGESCAGKSTLIERVMQANLNIRIIKSTTTRLKRDEKDNKFYYFINNKNFFRKKKDKKFIETVVYASNRYGFERKKVEDILKNSHGICAMTEHGVLAFIRLGYPMRVIKIIPKKLGNMTLKKQRKCEDKKREKILISFDAIIINSFKISGVKQATQELISFISKTI